MHNEVNKSLHKPEFDCSKVGDFYDCGCADEEKKEMKEEAGKDAEVGSGKKIEMAEDRKGKVG